MNSTDKNKYQVYRLIILILLAFSLMNPFIVLIFTKSILSTIIILLISTGILLLILILRKYKTVFILLYLFFILSSLLLSSEVVFQQAYSEYIIQDWYEYKSSYYFHKPGMNHSIKDKEYSSTFYTNAQGYRIGNIIYKDTMIPKCDWLFIGDSYTQGAQVDYQKLYTSKLFEYFPDKIVLNAGVSGFGLIDEYEYYLNEGKYLKPTKVFLQLCNFNDFMNVNLRYPSLMDIIMHSSDLARYLLYPLKYEQPEELPLGRWVEPFYANEQDNIEYNIFYTKRSKKKVDDIENIFKYLALFNKEVKKNNAELYIILVPSKEQVKYKHFYEVVSNYNIDTKLLDMNYPNKLIDSCAILNNFTVFDLKNVFENEEKDLFFEYDEHLNEAGHEKIANYLASEIKEDCSSEFVFSYYAGDRYPKFSRNGDMVFQSICDNNYELFVKKSDSIQRITFNDVDESHPCFSENGESIFFTEGDQSSLKTKVSSININTGKRVNISPAGYYAAIPNISSDGSQLTFSAWDVRHNINSNKNIKIVVHNIKNEPKTTFYSFDYEIWRPIINNKNYLGFIGRKSDNFDIFIYHISKDKTIQLTFTSFDEWDPNFNESGTKLVYAAKADGNWDLFELDLGNNTVTRLTNTRGDEYDPTYFNSDIYFAGKYGNMEGIFKLKK